MDVQARKWAEIAQKWARVLEEACGHCCGDNIAMDADSLGNALASYAEEATQELRAQNDELIAEIGKANELGQEWMAKAEAALGRVAKLEPLYEAAVSWHEFHHEPGVDKPEQFIQCDAICEAMLLAGAPVVESPAPTKRMMSLHGGTPHEECPECCGVCDEVAAAEPQEEK